MKYAIRRYDGSNGDDPPCLSAVLEDGLAVDIRTFKTPAEHDEKLVDHPPWGQEGKNHRIVSGGIRRDFPTRYWVIEITSLDDLMALIAVHGPISVSQACDGGRHKSVPGIVIMSGYTE